MPLLTIFTPTYNRAITLERTYRSLCNQTCNDFEWIIVDDGSTDNTEKVVQFWIKEQLIPIRYIKKNNGGLLSGYNKALEHISTELNVCIDSDDFMPLDAVEIIKNEWEKIRHLNLAGLIGLDYDFKTGKPLGGTFSSEGDFFYEERQYVVGHYNDVKVVCRTDLMNEIAPLNTFGEKDFNPIHFYIFISYKYKFRLINKCLCWVDYQSDGMTAGLFRQYMQSPLSNMETRRITMKSLFVPPKIKYRAAIHYVSAAIFAKKIDFIFTSPKKLLTLFALFPGVLLNIYIRWKVFRQKDKKFLV